MEPAGPGLSGDSAGIVGIAGPFEAVDDDDDGKIAWLARLPVANAFQLGGVVDAEKSFDTDGQGKLAPRERTSNGCIARKACSLLRRDLRKDTPRDRPCL